MRNIFYKFDYYEAFSEITQKVQSLPLSELEKILFLNEIELERLKPEKNNDGLSVVISSSAFGISSISVLIASAKLSEMVALNVAKYIAFVAIIIIAFCIYRGLKARYDIEIYKKLCLENKIISSHLKTSHIRTDK